MTKKPVLKIGHLPITDHLVLGITRSKIDRGIETFQYATIETVCMQGWNSIGSALKTGDIDIAFILAPYAMELFHSGEKINLILFSHKSGSIIGTNKNAHIEKIEDFIGKLVLIPYHLSVHRMLIDKLFNEKGLKIGEGEDVVIEVVTPSEIPMFMEWDEEGDIGGYCVAEPFGTQVIKNGLGEEFALSKDIWPGHPCCVVVGRKEILEENSDAVFELTESLVKSGMLVHQEPETAAEIGAEFLNQDYEIIYSVLTQPADRLITTELFPVLEDLELIQSYMTENISVMSGKIDLEKFVDLRFAEAAGAARKLIKKVKPAV